MEIPLYVGIKEGAKRGCHARETTRLLQGV